MKHLEKSFCRSSSAKLSVLAILMFAAGCTAGSDHPDSGEEAETPLQAVPVQVATAELTTLKPELDLVGTLIAIPERTALVSPQLGGWVEQLAVVEGQTVEEKQLLVQLDARSAQTGFERATAVVAEKNSALKRLRRGYLPQEIETARNDRDQAKATVEGLRGELTALDDLLKREEISPVAYDTKAKALKAAEAALASAEAHYKLFENGTAPELIEEAQAQLDVANADLEHAKLTLDWCSIKSPLKGVVVQLLAHQGQFFDRAVPLVTIIDMSELFVQIRVPTRHFASVRVGTPVEIQLESLPGKVFQGSIARLSGQADAQTGNIVVYALVKNQDDLLRPELSCQTRIFLPEVPEALAIPVAAIADNSGTPVVTVIREGKAFETEVETGTETQTHIQILNGLSPGDLVATAGGYGLPEGCPVKIVSDRAATGIKQDPSSPPSK